MERYNYSESVYQCISRWCRSHNVSADNYSSYDDMYESIYHELWYSSGHHPLSRAEAEEHLCHNWDLLREALREETEDYNAVNVLELGAEGCDVIIRQYLLSTELEAYLLEQYGEAFGYEADMPIGWHTK